MLVPPVPLIIFCTTCGAQHVDKVDPETGIDWSQRLHKRHLCSNCKAVFFPSGWENTEHFTVGVASINVEEYDAARRLLDEERCTCVGRRPEHETLHYSDCPKAPR
jgi:hypothetical protein